MSTHSKSRRCEIEGIPKEDNEKASQRSREKRDLDNSAEDNIFNCRFPLGSPELGKCHLKIGVSSSERTTFSQRRLAIFSIVDSHSGLRG